MCPILGGRGGRTERIVGRECGVGIVAWGQRTRTRPSRSKEPRTLGARVPAPEEGGAFARIDRATRGRFVCVTF